MRINSKFEIIGVLPTLKKGGVQEQLFSENVKFRGNIGQEESLIAIERLKGLAKVDFSSYSKKD